MTNRLGLRNPKLWLALGALVCIGVGVACWPRLPSEPSYRGMRLTAWLEAYNSGDGPPKEAIDEAICQMGTNAVPFLLEWERVSESPVKLRLIRWASQQKFFKFHYLSAFRREGLTFRAFNALSRCHANDVVRVLMQIYEGEVAYRYGGSRSSLLVRIGQLVPRIGEPYPGASPEIALPLLLRETRSTNVSERCAAFQVLQGYKADPKDFVPAMISGLGDARVTIRQFAATALGQYGSNAISAVPALRRSLIEANDALKIPGLPTKLEREYQGALEAAFDALKCIEKANTASP